MGTGEAIHGRSDVTLREIGRSRKGRPVGHVRGAVAPLLRHCTISICLEYGIPCRRQDGGPLDFVRTRPTVWPATIFWQSSTLVFGAIREQRFYILTHPERNHQIRARMEDILLERNPSGTVDS